MESSTLPLHNRILTRHRGNDYDNPLPVLDGGAFRVYSVAYGDCLMSHTCSGHDSC